MNTEEQQPQRRVRLIEMPGTKPLTIRARPEDECPNCERPMTWHVGRKGFICIPCNHQPNDSAITLR